MTKIHPHAFVQVTATVLSVAVLILITLVGCSAVGSGWAGLQDRRTAMPEECPHFDGVRFVNPTLEQQVRPGPRDVIGMMAEGRPDWPTRIENTATPRLDHALDGDDMAVTFVNHATFLLQMEGLTMLTDPVWSERVSPISWAGPRRVRDAGVAFEDLPQIDVVLISHNHYDHLDVQTLKRLEARFSPVLAEGATRLFSDD